MVGCKVVIAVVTVLVAAAVVLTATIVSEGRKAYTTNSFTNDRCSGKWIGCGWNPSSGGDRCRSCCRRRSGCLARKTTECEQVKIASNQRNTLPTKDVNICWERRLESEVCAVAFSFSYFLLRPHPIQAGFDVMARYDPEHLE